MGCIRASDDADMWTSSAALTPSAAGRGGEMTLPSFAAVGRDRTPGSPSQIRASSRVERLHEHGASGVPTS